MLYKKNPKLTYKNLLYFQDIVNDELLCEKYPVIITIKIINITTIIILGGVRIMHVYIYIKLYFMVNSSSGEVRL